MAFMRMALLKLAVSSSRFTLRHQLKNHQRVGSKATTKRVNKPILSAFQSGHSKNGPAAPNTKALKRKVPCTPNHALKLNTPSALSAAC